MAAIASLAAVEAKAFEPAQSRHSSEIRDGQ
jgi:hypothetical protein